MVRLEAITEEVGVLFPSGPAHQPLPDPIPAALYARRPAVPHAKGQAPGAAALQGSISDFRGWPTWRQALALVGGLFGLICVILAPWRPRLGLLGIVTLGIVILATNAWNVRGRLPLLRSADPRVAAGGWVVVGGLVLVATILVLAAPGGLSAGGNAARTSSPPGPAAGPSLVPVTPSPTPSLSPTPTARPVTATPRPTPPSVTFLNAPLSVQPGQTVTLRVATTRNTDCSISIGYPSGPDLDPATSDAAGNVSWTWRVGKHVDPGSWPVTVSCRSGTASTRIIVS